MLKNIPVIVLLAEFVMDVEDTPLVVVTLLVVSASLLDVEDGILVIVIIAVALASPLTVVIVLDAAESGNIITLLVLVIALIVLALAIVVVVVVAVAIVVGRRLDCIRVVVVAVVLGSAVDKMGLVISVLAVAVGTMLRVVEVVFEVSETIVIYSGPVPHLLVAVTVIV